MNRLLLIALLSASTLVWSEPAAVERSGLQHRISLEFKDLRLSNLFKVLGQVGHQEFQLDPALAEEKVTLKFKNVPVQLVLDAVAAQFDVRYVRENGIIRVEPASSKRTTADLQSELAELKARVAQLEQELAQPPQP